VRRRVLDAQTVHKSLRPREWGGGSAGDSRGGGGGRERVWGSMKVERGECCEFNIGELHASAGRRIRGGGKGDIARG